ncbi:Myosin light chain alkali [Apis cerana cerana]|uniref:Myosin light chain alkali n=1 Tax=Apis cerana cerana TaxID=94128 RepID=A0A2A3E7C7_APICC|nr:Myosin light chain alkali [Apis cerana cerana]
MPDNRQETTDTQSQAAQQMQDLLCTDRNETENAEIIEKMVCGLHNLQIGDSTPMPLHLSKLEKQISNRRPFNNSRLIQFPGPQVKHIVHNIDNIIYTEPATPVETHSTQGQGDVHQIIHDAVIEMAADPTCTRLEKVTDSSEATRVSTSLIYRMIEELESRMGERGKEENEESEPAVSKEKIEVWEESEEQFIRTIESIDDPDQNYVESIPESRTDVCDFAYDGLASSFVGSSTPFPKNSSLEEVAIEDITPSPLPPDVEQRPSGKTKSLTHNETQSEELKKKVAYEESNKCGNWPSLRAVHDRCTESKANQADLSAKEVEKAEFAFSIYDADGTNVIDATDLGNVLRALNLNPTNATIEKLGGTKKKGEKLMKLDEFLPIYSQCKKDKDQGCYEDFVECLKLYDKQENGTMLGAELSHTLLALGNIIIPTHSIIMLYIILFVFILKSTRN